MIEENKKEQAKIRANELFEKCRVVVCLGLDTNGSHGVFYHSGGVNLHEIIGVIELFKTEIIDVAKKQEQK